jgi:parvulin-like peptidyl-prolyl isomerase
MRTNLRPDVLAFLLLALLPGPAHARPEAASPEVEGGRTEGQDPRILLRVPLFADRFAEVPAATVGSDVITLRDLAESLAITHGGHEGAAKKQDFGPLLDRLVDARLIVAEARDMGLDELPEVKKAVTTWRETSVREKLKARATAEVKPDPEAVAAAYRRAVQEWKVRSVLFEQAADAAAFAAGATDPAAFGAAAEAAVAGGKARGGEEGQYLGRKRSLRQVVATVERMKVGEVSAPVQVPDGHAVLLLEDVRYPEDPALRAEVERQATGPLIQRALHDYYETLIRKHATVNRKLLAAVDYHARKPGIGALAKDRRVLARIRGEAPVTVADLTAELKTQFFHGLERAAKERKVNAKKKQFFDSLLFRGLLDKEAKVQGVADEPEFRRELADYDRSVVFTAFLEKVVVPEVKVTEEDARAHYEGHRAELTYPDFYKLETLAFASARDAQASCEKLRSGTDVKWLKANAEAQLEPKKRSLQVDGATVSAASMPEGLAAVLSGAGAGDCRIYAQSDQECYAVLVVDKVAARVQPFEEAREVVEQQVFKEKLTRSVKEWAARLREAHEVQVYVTGMAR